MPESDHCVKSPLRESLPGGMRKAHLHRSIRCRFNRLWALVDGDAQWLLAVQVHVNVSIVTCEVDAFEIVQASLSGGSPVSIAPVKGIDGNATATALDEAAPLLGRLPSELQVAGLSEVTQRDEFVEEIFAASSNTPPVFGVDYLGDPNDYSTWIAIGSLDVEVLVKPDVEERVCIDRGGKHQAPSTFVAAG